MINLKPYNENTIIFLESIIKSKRNSNKDSGYKERVNILVTNVKEKYLIFDINHSANSLALSVCHGYKGQDKKDLIKLYDFNNSVLKKLKNKVTTTSDNRLINTCQNCTINEINSFDHIIPKDEFPEFSVNPKNLFPSCTTCNNYKSINWREDGLLVFLNLYLDKLPKEQYLFAETKSEDGVITAKFSLQNVNNINELEFKLIQNHYEKLHLPERFRKNSHDTIYELMTEIKSYKDKIPMELIISSIKETIASQKLYYGYNFWKTILKESIINNEELINSI